MTVDDVRYGGSQSVAFLAYVEWFRHEYNGPFNYMLKESISQFLSEARDKKINTLLDD